MRWVTDVSARLRVEGGVAPPVDVVAPTDDGREVHGWVLLPDAAAFGAGPHPVLLVIHGGPFAAYGPHFSAEAQLYAAAGYVVLYSNPRGSTSYGEEFGNLIHHAYPGNDYDDLMAAVDEAVAWEFVDPDRRFRR